MDRAAGLRLRDGGMRCVNCGVMGRITVNGIVAVANTYTGLGLWHEKCYKRYMAWLRRIGRD